MFRKAACVLFGAIAGILVNVLGSLADVSRRDSQNVLGTRIVARSEVSSFQSTIVSVFIVLLIALVSALLLAIVVKRRTD